MVGELSDFAKLIGGADFKKVKSLGPTPFTAMVARAHRFKPTGFRPAYHGIDEVYENGGKLIIVESKGGSSHLAKGQMSKKWIDDKIAKLKQTDPEWGNKLETARRSGNLQGMVITTRIDGDLVQDPEFVLKDFKQIGDDAF